MQLISFLSIKFIVAKLLAISFGEWKCYKAAVPGMIHLHHTLVMSRGIQEDQKVTDGMMKLEN